MVSLHTLILTLKLKNSSENYNSIINFGTAGSNYLEPGSFVDCTKFIQRDMDCTPLGFPEFQTPFEDNIEINFYDYKNNFVGIVPIISAPPPIPISKAFL